MHRRDVPGPDGSRPADLLAGVSDDVGDEMFAIDVGHDFPVERPGLSEIVVLSVLSIGAPTDLAGLDLPRTRRQEPPEPAFELPAATDGAWVGGAMEVVTGATDVVGGAEVAGATDDEEVVGVACDEVVFAEAVAFLAEPDAFRLGLAAAECLLAVMDGFAVAAVAVPGFFVVVAKVR